MNFSLDVSKWIFAAHGRIQNMIEIVGVVAELFGESDFAGEPRELVDNHVRRGKFIYVSVPGAGPKQPNARRRRGWPRQHWLNFGDGFAEQIDSARRVHGAAAGCQVASLHSISVLSAIVLAPFA